MGWQPFKKNRSSETLQTFVNIQRLIKMCQTVLINILMFVNVQNLI